MNITDEQWNALFSLWRERHGTDPIRSEAIYNLAREVGIPLPDRTGMLEGTANGHLGRMVTKLMMLERTMTAPPFHYERVKDKSRGPKKTEFRLWPS